MTVGPLFVIGLARSGTNLLARMLARHSGVSMALDPLLPVFKSLRNSVIAAHAPRTVASRFDPASAFHDYYFDGDGPALLDTILGGTVDVELPRGELDVLRAGVKERAGLESASLAARLTGIGGRTYREVLTSACAVMADERPGAAWTGIKEVWIHDFVPMLARAFPQARFYFIDRDPRAIVASLLAMARRNPSQAAHVPSYLRHWRKSVALMRRFEADDELAGRCRVVTYESLVTDPEPEARRICAELDVPYTSQMLALSADGWAGNSSFGDVRDMSSGSLDRWRTELHPDAIATADAFCAPEMALTRYQPVAPPRLSQGVLIHFGHEATKPVSWTSDSGDALLNLGGEVLRLTLSASTVQPDESLVRRCFLFQGTLDAIRAPLATKTVATI